VTVTIASPIPPEFSLVKCAAEDPVAPGRLVTYTLSIVNNAGTAYGLVISDLIPTDTNFVSCGGAVCELCSA
jgi:uncharacterized repeat protein (TIGR01451 family)